MEENDLLEALLEAQADKDLKDLLPRLDRRMHEFQQKKRRQVLGARTLKQTLVFSVIAGLFFWLGLYVGQHSSFKPEMAQSIEPSALPVVLAEGYEQPKIVATGSDDPLALALEVAGLIHSASSLLRAREAINANDSEKLMLFERGPNTGIFRNAAALAVNSVGEIFIADRVNESRTIVYKIAPKRQQNRCQTPKPE